MAPLRSLNERLHAGEDVLCAEGYVFELERRGYLSAGPFVPEVVLDHPEIVKALHEEFVHAGSDVVLALTYYGNKQKLKIVGRENDFEALNRKALKIAKEVATNQNCLMAGNICNTSAYDQKNPHSFDEVRAAYKAQIELAVAEGADFIVAETLGYLGEAEIALDCVEKYGNGLAAVVTLSQSPTEKTHDDVPYHEACHTLETKGAAVVGLNCSSGPKRQIELMKKIRHSCKGPIASVPVTFRTTEKCPLFFMLRHPDTNQHGYPLNIDPHSCARDEIRRFGKECKEIGIQYAGLCCGNSSRYFRELAEAMGRKPPASRYAPRMDLHYIFSQDSSHEMKKMYWSDD